MLGVFGSCCVLTGSTSWMNWLRSPRLNSAVHSVGVLTCSSLSRVAGFNDGMRLRLVSNIAFQLLAGALDHAGPALGLAGKERGGLGRTRGHHLGTGTGHARADLWLADHLDQRHAEPIGDRLGQGCRDRHALVGARLEVLHALL